MKKVIAIPSEPVHKAGAKVLTFESVNKTAAYFKVDKAVISRGIHKPKKYQPFCGYYFDFLEDQEND